VVSAAHFEVGNYSMPSRGKAGTGGEPTDTLRSGVVDTFEPRFEMLLMDLADRFLRIGPADLDGEVEGTLRAIQEYSQSDICGFFHMDPGGGEALLSHVHASSTAPRIPLKTNYGPLSPWICGRSMRGEVTVLNSLAEFPAEGMIDRQLHEGLGIHAILSIPVSIRGVTRYALEIMFIHEDHLNLERFVPRLTMLADILAAMLERNRAYIAEEESDDRLELAANLVGMGFWDLDLRTGRIWATAMTRELYGIGPNETFYPEMLYGSVHEDDLDPLRRALDRSMREGEPLRVEHRIIVPGKKLRWLSVRGDRAPHSYGGGEHLLGVSADITDQKEAEENLKRSYEEIKRLKERSEAESAYLRKEIRISSGREEILGRSVAITRVLRQIEQVAATDSTVLIVGETGTGKELVARAIHDQGNRRNRVMVKVDCSSLPAGLIESELFGRERGAYTGALTKQIGRFQLADKSTILLDEIGELPREVQSKLLRVLQDGCFEVLGSPKTVKVDVRIIAATNRDLAREVREGRFREDLYYRLSIFPIEVPPLRDRKEDIPLLIWHFVEMFSSKMGKSIREIPKETMEALVHYHWPGNVRELRNLIEQAFIITSGPILNVRLPESRGEHGASPPRTLQEAEKQHILSALNSAHWQIKGAGGAAALLGLKPSTLYSKMKGLGIPNRRRGADASP
jgi:formate hydrogenlyase transcriptional activator